MRGRLSRIVLLALLAAAVAGGAIAANVLLLGYADSRSDPVGKLSPRATITQQQQQQQQRTQPPRLPVQTTDDHHDTTIEGPDD